MKLYSELYLDDNDECVRRMVFLRHPGKSFELPLDSLKGNIRVKEATCHHSCSETLNMNVVSVKEYN